MKKIILLLSIFTFVLTSCSSDDDGGVALLLDPVVGTWNYHMSLVNGQDQGLLPCENEETLVFSLDGAFLESFYDEDTNNNCVFDGSFSGVWTSLGNNMYALTYTGDTESYEHEIQGNLLYYTLTFDNGTPNDTSDDFTESEVYMKQ